MARRILNMDGNTACAHIAHATNEVIAIYPITPSSVMGELADEKSARGETNIWGSVPLVSELQSEGGAAGAVHGALSAGALTTTFTASQGLLLMIPNMYKIAGECTPTVFHVSARALATQGLSIFGDHSDVMAARATGFVMLASNNPQEVMDFALIAQAASLKMRLPVLHFFDGFRTSHEMSMAEELTFDDMRSMLDDKLVRAHRERSLSPDKPTIKGTSQNPDVYFQAREAANTLYANVRAVFKEEFERFYKLTGRRYDTAEYYGAPDAEHLVMALGSACGVIEETIDELNSMGYKAGLIKVRLFLPFDEESFLKALPKGVKVISVLDRTKEPGSLGEPFYQTVQTALIRGGRSDLKVLGGRFGLGSKDFTPAMVKAVFDNMKASSPKSLFTVGIEDDLAHTSLAVDYSFTCKNEGVYNAMFYGLGSDGTVGANKNTAKIICDETDKKVQAYFVYDSKKSGSVTTSHLRFSKNEIKSSYLIDLANFIACHNFSFLESFDVLKPLKKGGTFLLNSIYSKDEVWGKLPAYVRAKLSETGAKFYVIDAVDIAEKLGLGGRTNMVLQAAFFKISALIEEEKAKAAIGKAIKKTYGKYGEKTVSQNLAAMNEGFEGLYEVNYPKEAGAAPFAIQNPASKSLAAPLITSVIARLIANEGESVKVSEIPMDGVWPTGTAKYEKRNVAVHIPVWDESICTHCAMCSFVCPHAAIRIKVYDEALLKDAPESFKSAPTKDGKRATVQVAPEDCTGCENCVANCPVVNKLDNAKKSINMEPQAPIREREGANFDFFLTLPDEGASLPRSNIKGLQMAPHYFEFSGACAGCGETPYIRVLTQLFGDRLFMANATGCSSIYGGNLPTTPYTKDREGRGPAWANSLFEDNAEFGFGMRLSADYQREYAQKELKALEGKLDKTLTEAALNETDIRAQREAVDKLKQACESLGAEGANLLSVADKLVKKSVWILGGDGWAYDIGYGGLDHIIAQGLNVNILVLDTEVYSNTGGQASKSTPLGANAKFASVGKKQEKKDLGLIAMTYGHVYVAHVSLANPAQCIKAFIEAESYDGPSLIIAYSHCIAHGIDMKNGIAEQKKAVQAGYWQLYRYDPRLRAQGKNPLQLDTKKITGEITQFMEGENRFRITKKQSPESYAELAQKAADLSQRRFKLLEKLSTD